MKMRIILCLLAGALLSSCNKFGVGHGMELLTTVFIGGDTGKVVTITHLTRSKVAGPTHPNVEASYEVTIPFYGYISARCWDGSACDNLYAQVSTDGETEAKIIMGSVILRDGICGSAEIFERTPVLWAHSDEECTTCRICRYTQTWPIDSLYAYLEEIKYPTYKVIRKGEDYAEVNEKDCMGWKNPYELPDSVYAAHYNGDW
ncbi:MAG: hypothetical protein LBG47_00015 [Prevotellaceae bacterium]|nr:hypothetical protein [Prevotellaceae bacterium]